MQANAAATGGAAGGAPSEQRTPARSNKGYICADTRKMNHTRCILLRRRVDESREALCSPGNEKVAELLDKADAIHAGLNRTKDYVEESGSFLVIAE